MSFAPGVAAGRKLITAKGAIGCSEWRRFASMATQGKVADAASRGEWSRRAGCACMPGLIAKPTARDAKRSFVQKSALTR
jgi:hypothetical protein